MIARGWARRSAVVCAAGWVGFAALARAATCPSAPEPAATLLVPYFEVDLASAAGPTTLVAVSNAGEGATLAHVVLWTDWALPTLAFDLVLGANDVQTINLRDLFAGTLPRTGGAEFPGCTDPLTLPVIDAEALRRQHTGQPDEANRCSGSGRRGPAIATGFVTIDVARACSASVSNPTANGYFDAGGSGIASNDNLLLGDYLIVDSAANLAVGNEAVHLVADAGRFGGESATFYGVWNGHSGEDARAPLGTGYRTRYLDGGLFSGGTDLLIWAEPSYEVAGPVTCGERAEAVDRCQSIELTWVDEEASPAWFGGFGPVTEVANRVEVGGADTPAPSPFGFVDVRNRVRPLCDVPIGPPPILELPLQLVVVPLIGAQGRFAVGFNAHRLEDELCPP